MTSWLLLADQPIQNKSPRVLIPTFPIYKLVKKQNIAKPTISYVLLYLCILTCMMYKNTYAHLTNTCNSKAPLKKLTLLKKAINIHGRCFDFSCLDTLDLRQSTFAQWRFEQWQTSCFVDTKLLDTIHLEHDNMVQRCIGATKLTSDTYRYLQYKELQEQAPCTVASRCLQHHMFDKIWWDVFVFGYLWPLTSTSECVGSVVPVQSAAEVGCCCIHKSQSKGVRGQQVTHTSSHHLL